MDVSIIICTHNRQRLLARLLDSLAALEWPEGLSGETVVVGNGCSDGTEEAVRRWIENGSVVGLRWVAENRLGKSYALNRGLAEAQGDLLLFCDDDQRVSPGWLAAVVASVHAAPGTLCFCGRVLPDWTGSEPQWARGEGSYPIIPCPIPTFDLGAYGCDVQGDGFLPGGGSFYFRRSLLEIVPGFDPQLGPHGHDHGGGEDTAFVKAVLAHGCVIRYVPEVVQYHYVDRERLRMSSLLRFTYRRHRDLRRITVTPDVPKSFGVPHYLLSQLGILLLSAVGSIDRDQRRYFLVKCAARFGEIRGYRAAYSLRRGG